MQQRSPIVETLKKVLKTRGITYKALADSLALSEASVKRVFAEETFTLKRLEEICDVLEIDLFELARLSRGESARPNEMTVKQEEALASDAKLLGMFYLLFNDWQLEDVMKQYHVTRAEGVSLLAKLDRLSIIDLLPNDRVKLNVPKTLRLRLDGPIRKSYGKRVVGDFLAVQFDEHGGHFRFEFRELSKASQAIIERRLDRLAAEFHELAELDSYLPSEQRETVGLAAGVRPWEMSFVTGLKPRADAAPPAARLVPGRAGVRER